MVVRRMRWIRNDGKSIKRKLGRDCGEIKREKVGKIRRNKEKGLEKKRGS